MNAPQTLHQACSDEVTWIHEFFVAWFLGTVADDDAIWQTLDVRLHEDFVLVSPGGQTLSRDALLAALRPRHGAHLGNHFQIEVRNVEIRHSCNDNIVVSYEEWQQMGSVETARVSTAVLGREPSGFRWISVHETWLPGKEAS